MRVTKITRIGVILVGFVAVAFMSAVTCGQAHAGGQYPFRLRLRLERTALSAGETIGLFVELLDRGYNKIPNDRERVVWFDQPSGEGVTGSATVSPKKLTIPPGVSVSDRAVLRADSSGKLIVRVNSEGLASDQTYLLILTSKRSSVVSFLFPTAYADSESLFEIEPREQQIPANNVSQAQFTIFLAGGDLPAAVKVSSDPPCSMRAGGREGLGAVLLRSNEAPASFDPVLVSSSRPGRITVTAEVLPSGPTTTAFVDALPPRPSKILFDVPDGSKIRRGEDSLFALKLVDCDDIDIQQLDHQRQIRLTSPTDRDRVRFDQTQGEKTIVLPSQPPVAQVLFTLTGTPHAREIRLRAEDSTRSDLQAGVKTLIFEGDLPPLAQLLVIAALGGVAGGLIKDANKIRFRRFWPKFRRGQLDLGILGRLPCSLSLGLVLFAAARVGLMAWSALATQADGSPSQMRLMAMLFGVVGGFGGTAVLERLLNRVLPAEGSSSRELAGPVRAQN
jgi:hypothetical protein